MCLLLFILNVPLVMPELKGIRFPKRIRLVAWRFRYDSPCMEKFQTSIQGGYVVVSIMGGQNGGWVAPFVYDFMIYSWLL